MALLRAIVGAFSALLLCAMTCSAQLVAPELRTISMRDGLSDDHVWALAKDQRGNLWIGTKNGLNRFDGRHISVFHAEGSANSLPGDYITALAVDTGRILYVGTNAPFLTLFDILEDTLINIPLPVPAYSQHGEQRITSMHMDRQNRLWIGHGARCLSLFDPGTRSFRTTEIPPPLPTPRVREHITFIDEDADGVLWLSTFRGLVRFDPRVGEPEPIELHMPLGEQGHASVFHIRGIVDEDTALVFGTWSEGIFRMHKSDGTLRLLWPDAGHVPTMVDHLVTNMCRLPDGMIMVATIDQGLLQLDPRSGVVSHFDRSLREQDSRRSEPLFAGCYRLLALPEALVMGSTLQGVAIWPLRNKAVRAVQLPPHPEHETIDLVMGASHDRAKGEVVVLSERRGLFLHDTAGTLLRHIGTGYDPDLQFGAVCNGQDGSWLLAAYPQSFVAQPGADRLNAIAVEPAGTPCADGAAWMRSDGHGGYWNMSSSHGLHHWDPANGTCAPITDVHPQVAALLSDQPWDVFVDKSGASWFLSANTPPVVLHTDGRVERVNGPPGLSPFEVSDIAQTPDGRIWLAVKHRGLAMVETPSLSPIAVVDVSGQLPGRNILEVVAMEDGSLWMSQPNTLMHWDPRSGAARILNVLDGIVPAPLQLDPDHAPTRYPLLVGTWEGFYMIQKDVLRSAALPNVQLTKLLLGDSVFARHVDRLHRALTLPVSPERITFILRTDNLIDPQRDEIAYRMIGSDTAWSVTANEERITFNHLGAGSYRFEVKARTNGGEWGAISAVPFIVPPPFWATWWFRVLIGAAFVAVVIAVFRMVLRRRLKEERARAERQRALMEERMRIAHDLHDDLGSSLALIAMEGELARMDESADPRDALKRVSEGAREVTDNMRRIVWALGSGQDTLGDLVAYVRASAAELLERAEVELAIETSIIYPQLRLSTDQRRHVLLITKELLLNVVKHAHARKAGLRLAQVDGALHMTVADDGRGYDPRERNGSGTGTTSVSERAKALGGTVMVNTAPGAGTMVIVVVPLPAATV